MSLSTPLIGGIGGALIGFFTGGSPGALQGLQIGTFVGGLIDANKSPAIIGPRLSDLTVQTSTYGAVIPRTYGTVALCGNVFWLENNQLKEVATTNKSGGKGGGGGSEYETFTYYATFALGLCEGPIVGVRRIWIGKKLIYDIGSSNQDAMRASNSASTLFTLHTGSDTQLPDGRMQATLGVANTPAYRGLAYLVFKDLPLRDYGNSIAGAQVKVEVVGLGLNQSMVTTVTSLPSVSAWRCIASNGEIFVAGGENKIATSPDGITWTTRTSPVNAWWSDIVWNGKVFCMVSGWNRETIVSKDGIVWMTGQFPINTSASSIAWNGTIFCVPLTNGLNSAWSIDGLNWTTTTYPAYNNQAGQVVWSGERFVMCGLTASYYGDGISPWSYGGAPPASEWGRQCIESNGTCIVALNYNSNTGIISYDHGLTWAATVSIPYSDIWKRMIYANGMFFATSTGGNYWVWSYDGSTWSGGVAGSIATGDVAWNGAVYAFVQDGNTAASRIVRPLVQVQNYPNLASVVSGECLNSKFLVSGDIDVTLLSQQVRGYMVSSVAAIRAALSPLQGAFQFDIIQSGYKIKFKPRGNSSVVTIPAKDLGAEGIT